MNEQAIIDSYNVFVSQGYTKSIDEYKKLLKTNPDALKDSYDAFVSQGYSKSIDDYKVLMGVSEKKNFSSDSGQSQQPQPKAMASSLEDGSLDIQPQPSKKKKLTFAKDTGIKDMSGRTILSKKITPEAETFLKNVEEERVKKEFDKKKFEDAFRYFSVKPKPSESSYLKERLQSVDTELMNFEQDYVANELDYQFGDLGFKFEPSGVIGDYVKVTAPNNKTVEISVDNLFDKKSRQQSETLKKFITENTPAKGLFVLEKTMREQDKKFNSQKQVDDSIKAITNEVNLLNQKQKEILLRKSSLDKEIEEYRLNPTQEKLTILQQKKAQFDADVKKVLEEESTIKAKGLRLNQAVAKYGISKAREGSWIGGIWDSFNRGIGRMTSGITSLITDIQTELAPTGYGMSPNDLKSISTDIAKEIGVKAPLENQTIDEWKKTLSKDQLNEWEDKVDDYIKKDIKSKTLPFIRIGAEEVFGDPATTTQWADLKKKDFWGGAILGVAESLPAMIGGSGPAGWAQRTAQMYAQISDSVTEEMENDPDFKNITENEKLALTLPIGITSAVLEAYGLRNVLASKGVINSIALRALGRAGVGASAKTFRELVENEVNSMLAKGLLTITAAGAAEFETGALQELSETGYKVLYDNIKGKDMFNTPDSITDLIENVAVAGAQEAVGGFLLGIPSGVSAAYSKKGFLAMDDNTFETFASMANDSNMQSAYIASLKQQITQGIITEKEAKDQLNDYRNSVGLYRQLPDGLTTQQKKEAMNLLKERKDLENYIQNKDAALVTKQKSRIDEINNLLTNLSETNAIQEQSPAAVPVQPETRDSQTMEEGISQPKPEIATEQITQEEVVEPLRDVETTTQALRDKRDLIQESIPLTLIPEDVFREINTGQGIEQIISEAYHQAKQDGSNPDLVKAVEELLAPKTQEEVKDFDLTLPNNKENIVVADSPNGFILIDSETKAPIEVLNENAGENSGISKPYATQEEAQARIEELKVQPTQEIDLGVEENPLKEVENTANFLWNIQQSRSTNSEEINNIYNSLIGTVPFVGSNADSISQAYHKAKEDGSNPELVEKVEKLLSTKPQEGAVGVQDEISQPIELSVPEVEAAPIETKVEEAKAEEAPAEKIKGGDILNPNSFLNDKQLTYQEDFDLANSELKELESQERTLAVQREIEQKVKEINRVKEQAAKAAETKADVAPITEDINELLDLDTKNPTNLQRIASFLDSIDESLNIDPNELNDVTRVMAVTTAKAIVKTLKALVNAGITLQEALRQVAVDNNIDEAKIIEAIQIVADLNKNKSEGISEFEIPGYNRLSSKIDDLISSSETIDNVLQYVEQSSVYENATDVQKEAIIRDVRKRFGLKEKSAPSVSKLFGKVKDIKKITMTEKEALIKQIRDKARGARDAVKAQKEFAAQLAKDVKDLQEKGKITVKQAANILSKFSKVNVFSDSSVSNFVDYMSKVFADADYDNKISIAKSKLKAAKKNIATKIGIADGLMMPLQTLMSVNPNIIPSKYLNRYLSLVDMFSARKSVLTLEEISTLTQDVNDILNEINVEQSLAEELAYRLENSPSLVIENGEIDYAETIKAMLKNDEITQDEADLIKKYKSIIFPKIAKQGKTEQEIEDEKKVLILTARRANVDSSRLPTRDERNVAKKIASMLRSEWIKSLSNTELQNLLKIVDNINNGYLPHSAQLMTETIDSIADADKAAKGVNKAKLPPLSSIYAKVKSKITRKDFVLEMIRRNPLGYIDQVLGDFKTTDVFDAILRKSAEAEAKFTSEMKAIHFKLRNAENNVAKSFKFNGNDTLMSKFKMMTYLIQLEYQSNPNNYQVNPAAEYLRKTIDHIYKLETKYSDKDAKMLEYILDEFAPNGEIDIDALYNSFNSAEREAIKTIRELNESLTEKAQFTSAIIRGQKMSPLNNYIHLNVLSESRPGDLMSGQSFADSYNNSLMPSTKAKSLIERTKGAKPLNFDVFTSAERGAKYVLMDYHLTAPIRTARKTLNRTEKNLQDQGDFSGDKRKVFNAISAAFKEAIKNLVDNSYMETSIGEEVADEISRQGYRAVLASTGRFASEFLSNVGFVLWYGSESFAKGLKHFDIMTSDDFPKIMNNVNSKEINRILPSDTLSGRMIDQNILNQSNGIVGGTAKGFVRNKASQLWNLTGKKYKNRVELLADMQITTPDKVIMRPVWTGAFATEFERLAGRKITKDDFKKIAENNEQYMDQNKDIIEKAKEIADRKSVITGASSNAFTGLLKGTAKPTQSGWVRGFNNFNNFMTRFLIYEYVSARTAIMASIGDGTMSKKEGVALLAAVTTRMTVYSMLTKAIGGGLIELLISGGDDEEEDKKSFGKSATQAILSSATSLLFGRDFGNATKTFVNYGIERINENHLQSLREGEYDPYKDQLQYTAVPIGKSQNSNFMYDMMKNMTGSFGPAINTGDLIFRSYFGPDKKDVDAIERQEKEKNVRVPLEVLGNLGYVPFYKEVRKAVMKDIYKDLIKKEEKVVLSEEDREEADILTRMIQENPSGEINLEMRKRLNEILYDSKEKRAERKSKSEAKKKMKEKLLEGYDNQEEMKRYAPDKWEENFGENSDWYKSNKKEKELDKLIEEEKQAIKDAQYNYVPEPEEEYKFGPQKKKKSNYKFGAQ